MPVEIDHAVVYEPLEHFAPWEAMDHLSSACALSYDTSGDYLAVGRNDGSISIYELREIPLLALTLDLCIELGGLSVAKEYSCSCMAWLGGSREGESGLSTHLGAVFAHPERTNSIVCIWNLRSRSLIHIICVEGLFTNISFLFGRHDVIAGLRVQSREECPLNILDFSSHTTLYGSHLEIRESICISGLQAVTAYLIDTCAVSMNLSLYNQQQLPQERSIPVRRCATMLLTTSHTMPLSCALHYLSLGAAGRVSLVSVLVEAGLSCASVSECGVLDPLLQNDGGAGVASHSSLWGHLSIPPNDDQRYILVAAGRQQDPITFALQELRVVLYDVASQSLVGDVDLGVNASGIVSIQLNSYNSVRPTSVLRRENYSITQGDMSLTIVHDIGDKSSSNGVKTVVLRKNTDVASGGQPSFSATPSSICQDFMINPSLYVPISKRRFPLVAVCPTRPVVVAVDVRPLKRGTVTASAGAGMEVVPASTVKYVLSGDLWLCRGGIADSEFASAMYPPGYRVVSEISKCREREDEFDVLPSGNTTFETPQLRPVSTGSSSRKKSGGSSSKRTYEEMSAEKTASEDSLLKPNARVSAKLALASDERSFVMASSSKSDSSDGCRRSIFDVLTDSRQSVGIIHKPSSPLPMEVSDFAALPAEFTVVVRPTATQPASALAAKFFPIKNGFDIDFVPLTKQALKSQQSGAGGGRPGFGDGFSAMPVMAITRRGESIGGPHMPSLAHSNSVADAMQSASRTAAASIAFDTLHRQKVKSQSAAEQMAAMLTDSICVAQYLVESERARLETVRVRRRGRRPKATSQPDTAATAGPEDGVSGSSTAITTTAAVGGGVLGDPHTHESPESHRGYGSSEELLVAAAGAGDPSVAASESECIKKYAHDGSKRMGLG